MARRRTEEGEEKPAYAMLLCSDPFWKCQKDTYTFELRGITTKTRIEFCST